MTEKYVGWIEADAAITVRAKDVDEAREKLKNIRTGHLGPAKVRGVELFDSTEQSGEQQ